MLPDVDYAAPLIRLDEAVRQIYPSILRGQWTEAFKHALKAQEELTRFMAMCVSEKGKNERS